MKKALLTCLILVLAIPSSAKDAIFFTGMPQIHIQENGITRKAEPLSPENAEKLKCVITKKDDQYFWTSRDNIQLIPVPYGVFITFMAVDGSGYVRITGIEMTEENPEGPAKEPEEKYNYSEHQLMGLKSVTFYGKAK